MQTISLSGLLLAAISTIIGNRNEHVVFEKRVEAVADLNKRIELLQEAGVPVDTVRQLSQELDEIKLHSPKRGKFLPLLFGCMALSAVSLWQTITKPRNPEPRNALYQSGRAHFGK